MAFHSGIRIERLHPDTLERRLTMVGIGDILLTAFILVMSLIVFVLICIGAFMCNRTKKGNPNAPF
jgi:hypothetical protein